MTCERCGIEENSTRMEQRKIRKSALLCVSCAAKPARTVKTSYGVCEPHQGYFDEYDNPLDDAGKLYRPGFRQCGNADCVAEDHVLLIDVAEAERNDVSYRTGVKLSPVEWWIKLSKERL